MESAELSTEATDCTPENTSSSVTPSPSIQTIIQNHVPTAVMAETSSSGAIGVISNGPVLRPSVSRCSNKSASSNEDGNFMKLSSFGKSGVNLK